MEDAAEDEESYLLEDDDPPSATIASDTELISEGGGHLPVFLTEPLDAFVVKSKPATLRCKAAHALQVYFRCNGARADESQQQDFVDPHTGTRIVDCELNVTRDNIEEYFGKDKFKCDCIAWSGSGSIKSQTATIDVACEYSPDEEIQNSKWRIQKTVRRVIHLTGVPRINIYSVRVCTYLI